MRDTYRKSILIVYYEESGIFIFLGGKAEDNFTCSPIVTDNAIIREQVATRQLLPGFVEIISADEIDDPMPITNKSIMCYCIEWKSSQIN